MMKNKNKTGTLKEIKSKISFFNTQAHLLELKKLKHLNELFN